MWNFLQKISSALSGGGEPLDTIIHLGAGQHAERSDYEGLPFQKLILVEGDPEAAELLSAADEGDPSVQVISKLVSPAGGDIRYYRYNLSSLNGILPQGRLRSIYPRLRLLDEEMLQATTMTSLIEGFQIDGDRRILLILDLPGQEADLIESMSREQLRKFRFIVIHGCLEAYQEGAKELGQTLSLLGKLHYKLVEQDVEEDPQWPLALLEFDGAIAEVVHQRDELQSVQAVLNEELEHRARLLVEKATQIHQQGERVAELESALGEVIVHRDALQGEVAELQGQLEHANALQTNLQNQVADLSAAVASKETLLDVLSKGRVQQDRMYDELSEEYDGLLKRIQTLESRAQSLEQQIQERDGKSQLVDAEFQKVEGQMEIIKEIFLKGNALK